MRWWVKFSQLSGVGPTHYDTMIKAKRYAYDELRNLKRKQGFGTPVLWCYLMDLENNRKRVLYINKKGLPCQTRWREIYTC